MNIFEEVRSRVDCREVARHYGIEFRGGRARCPLHHGSGYNFFVTRTGYTCFSHCGSGDVINLVQRLFEYKRPLNAVKWLNTDFNLGINLDSKPLTREELERMRELTARSKGRAQAIEKVLQLLNAMSLWTHTDLCKEFEPFSDEFVVACNVDLSQCDPLWWELHILHSPLDQWRVIQREKAYINQLSGIYNAIVNRREEQYAKANSNRSAN